MCRKNLSNIINQNICHKLTNVKSDFHVMWPCNQKQKHEKSTCVEKSLVTLSTIISAIGRQNIKCDFHVTLPCDRKRHHKIQHNFRYAPKGYRGIQGDTRELIFMSCGHVIKKKYKKLRCIEKSSVTLSTIISVIGRQKCEV